MTQFLNDDGVQSGDRRTTWHELKGPRNNFGGVSSFNIPMCKLAGANTKLAGPVASVALA